MNDLVVTFIDVFKGRIEAFAGFRFKFLLAVADEHDHDAHQIDEQETEGGIGTVIEGSSGQGSIRDKVEVDVFQIGPG